MELARMIPSPQFSAVINLPIEAWEVPELRTSVGWSPRRQDYPTLFERCMFWAGIRDSTHQLVAFGYMVGMGLEHGYIEDIMVRPTSQEGGLG